MLEPVAKVVKKKYQTRSQKRSRNQKYSLRSFKYNPYYSDLEADFDLEYCIDQLCSYLRRSNHISLTVVRDFRTHLKYDRWFSDKNKNPIPDPPLQLQRLLPEVSSKPKSSDSNPESSNSNPKLSDLKAESCNVNLESSDPNPESNDSNPLLSNSNRESRASNPISSDSNSELSDSKLESNHLNPESNDSNTELSHGNVELRASNPISSDLNPESSDSKPESSHSNQESSLWSIEKSSDSREQSAESDVTDKAEGSAKSTSSAALTPTRDSDSSPPAKKPNKEKANISGALKEIFVQYFERLWRCLYIQNESRSSVYVTVIEKKLSLQSYIMEAGIHIQCEEKSWFRAPPTSSTRCGSEKSSFKAPQPLRLNNRTVSSAR